VYPSGNHLSNAADILPLRAGHALVIPKHHCQRLSDLPEKYAAAVGIAVSKVARALTLGMSILALLGGKYAHCSSSR
jgi:diadenosine tetraphosphate (Ap4A) HIT family hydrolase